MKHLQLTPDARRRINPEYGGGLCAPCCGNGDFHAVSVSDVAQVDCPACLERAAAIVREEDSILKMHPGRADPKNGRLLTMGDGSQWHHPYSGGAPLKIA